MNIILANLGNRNILYKEKTYQQLESSLNPRQSFREWTRYIVENWEEEKGWVKLNILDHLLNEKANETTCLVLFYSDQMEERQRDQDTIFIADIVEDIVLSGYKNIKEVKKIKVDSSVVDNESLLHFYRNIIYNLNRIHEKPFFTICDAGGTAQQKSALKIITEFLIPQNKYEVLYINAKSKQLEKVDQREYRNIIQTEQAIQLIRCGEFEAASVLLEFRAFHDPDSFSSSNWREWLFGHVYYRFYQERGLSIKCSNKLSRLKPVIVHFKTGEKVIENEELYKVFQSPNDWLEITDRLYKCLFYLELGNYNETIMAFAQFYETFLTKCIESIYDFDLESKNEEKVNGYMEKTNEIMQKNYHHYIQKNPKFSIHLQSLSVKCMLLKVSEFEFVRNIASNLSPYIEYTDDSKSGVTKITSIRNKIAHSNKLVTSSLKEKLNYLPDLIRECSKSIGLKQNNVYSELIDILEKSLRQ